VRCRAEAFAVVRRDRARYHYNQRGAAAEFRCRSAAWRCRPLSARGVKHVDNRRFGQRVILHKAERKRAEKHSSRTRFALFDLLAATHARNSLDRHQFTYDAAARKFISQRVACVRLANFAKCRLARAIFVEQKTCRLYAFSGKFS